MAAMENPRIRAYAVDAAAFGELARRNGVRSVPHTIIEGARRVTLAGGGPEERFLAALLQAARE
ncbi:MAG: hypothetical protein CWE10_11855 [Symbiobacterium thermophilum]|jgi:hypothetical protein|uniref:Thioredoxin-like fold domain-containing protein n=2 Tax=Symbiobacterium thermophilum TaxID=2734 RepID=Q67MP9_SYMTH|nr:hypothetical protein [Symbiobacterium thermophilum]BAD41044.1 hypothetical protein STH2059 [Symbiobacterium thermophilum IAM 14863]